MPSLIPKSDIKLAVVGEAPGPQEAKTGIPFTGPSGELLDRVLEHHGYNRQNVALVNSVSCRPHGPTEKPPKAAVSACAARLHDDLTRAKAPMIVAVGGVGAQSLLGTSKPISKLRIGPAKESIFGPVIATWHPAYCLRTPDAFPSFVRDIGKINGIDIPPWKPPKYKVFNDPDVALEAIRRLLNVDKIVIDIEAASDKDIDDSHPEDYELLCVGVAYAQGQAVVFGSRVFQDSRCIDAFSKLLTKAKIGGHNLKFDLLGLSPVFGVMRAGFDTMLKSYVLDERPRQHGLKMRAVEDLNAPQYDDEITQYVKGKDGSFANIPKDILYKYNAYDVGVTWDLDEFLSLRMSPEQFELHEFLISAANELMHIELSPLHFDLEYNAQLEIEYSDKLKFSEEQINDHLGFELNPRSPLQITRFFAEHANMVIPTTSRDFMEKLREKVDGNLGQFIDLLLENRKLAKLYGTYVKGLRKKVKDGRIYTTFSLHGTTSGRLASRKPNLQNVARNKSIRNQFTAAPGKILVQSDYSQIEGRVIATLAKDEYLKRVFSDPTIDIFDDLCDQIWGVGNWDKENRVSIKSIFYGNAYGRKAKSIAHELKKPVVYAQNLMNQFKQLIPGVVAWQASIRTAVLNGEDLSTPFGRKRTFHLLTNDNLEDVINEALSYKPQSIASDICLRAAIRLRPMLKERFDADIKLLIHDAIVVECTPEVKHLVITCMEEEMVKSAKEFTDWIPFKVETTSAFRLGEL